MTWSSGPLVVGVPLLFVERLSALTGLDPYRDRVMDEREIPALRAALHDARLAIVREHVQEVGGDQEEWRRAWAQRRMSEDAWLRLLDELVALVDLGGEVRFVAD